MKIVAIIQARINSSRLPNKVLHDLSGKSLLEHVVLRLKPSKKINKIVVATTTRLHDDQIEDLCKRLEIDCYRGSETNVLERYFEASKLFKADIIIRITADDPFKDYRIIDNAIDILIEKKLDFVCNNNPPTFPEGLDVEVITFEALKNSYLNATTDFQREHVTQYIHQNQSKYKIYNIQNASNLSDYRWTIDTLEDFTFARKVYDKLYVSNKIFLTEQILALLQNEPALKLINANVAKSDMYKNKV
jgi:spore coat polysaccharide biosynthesis protein SpsF